ncbi:MAG TPA: trypsin-like peptidase domain-containing protein [Bacillota bacterium]|nr:trypsin-like peptidase domain-containing protein [Bacillota bacterium]
MIDEDTPSNDPVNPDEAQEPSAPENSEGTTPPEGAYQPVPYVPAPQPPQPPRRRGGWLGTLAVALVAAIVGGLVVAYAGPTLSPRLASQVSPPTITTAQSSVLNDSPAISVAQKVTPAVVLVLNQSTQQGYFGTQQQTASGSGIIFDSQGYIVTNDHVVYGSSKLTVVLSDGTVLPATVIGQDAPTDLAVIKVNATKPLPTATFGDSSKVVPGQFAITVGNPLGTSLTDSITMGVVSGIRNESYGFVPSGQTVANQRVTQVIQTDAAINPGNSGGPLLNSLGQVIGITSYKTVQAEPGVPASGIGFAIPSNTVEHVISDLVKYGQVHRGYIGVTLQSPQALLPNQAVPVTIASVSAGGPAAKAGLQVGDQIVSVNGAKVSNTDDVIAEVNKYEPGTTITLGIVRGGKTLAVKVTLSEQAPTTTPSQGG